MRVRELYEQVAGLGFEKSLEEDDWFYQAANRALLQVNYIRPAIGSYVINHKPLKNLLASGFKPIQRSSDLVYEATGAKAYYFEADGEGKIEIRTLSDSGTWDLIGIREFKGSKNFAAYSGFIKDGGDFVPGTVRLTFTGDYLYSVRNVAAYEHIFSASTDDIPPYAAHIKYDMSRLVDDFIGFASPLVTDDDEYDQLSDSYDLEGNNVLLIPHSVSGCFKVLYYRRPKEIVNEDSVAQDDETVIDLDEELCSLLPILIASYIWLDDEPDRAQYYNALYQSRANEILAKQRNYAPVRMRSCNDW